MKNPLPKYKKGEVLVHYYDRKLKAKVLAYYFKLNDYQYYYKVIRATVSGGSEIAWIAEANLTKPTTYLA